MNIKERVDKAIEEIWAMSSEEFRAVFENSEWEFPDEDLDDFTVSQKHIALPEHVHRSLSVRKANQFEISTTSRIEISPEMPASGRASVSMFTEDNSLAVESEARAA